MYCWKNFRFVNTGIARSGKPSSTAFAKVASDISPASKRPSSEPPSSNAMVMSMTLAASNAKPASAPTVPSRMARVRS